MRAIKERVSDMAKRCGDLSPLREPIRQKFFDGNRQTIMAGVSPGSTAKVSPLAPSTLKRRKGKGPPRAPQGEASRIVAGCVVNVTASTGQLAFVKSYPGLDRVSEYLDRGTSRMPGRPFMNFRAVDTEWVRKQVSRHVIGGGLRGFASRIFGS